MKKHMMPTILAFCLAFLLYNVALAADTPAMEGACGEGLTWKYEPDMNEQGRDQGGTLTISGNGVMENYTYGSTPWNNFSRYINKLAFNGQPTNIGDYSFSGCSELVDVAIPDSVTSIGVEAFTGCSKITNITIPESVTNIGLGAFSSCSSLPSITIPGSVKNIAYATFGSCTALTSVTLQQGILSIERDAFRASGITTIFIPASVIRIDETFGNSANLQEINVAQENKIYSSSGGVLFDKDGGTLIRCPQGKISYDISVGTVAIGGNAFSSCCNLTSITIPDTVTDIGYSAFMGCSKLNSIKIPDSVKTIGSTAFRYCIALKEVNIPALTDNTLSLAFSNCTALVDVVIPEGITRLSETFSGCTRLISISLPASLKEIGRNTFQNCTNLKTVTYAGTETQWGAITIAEGNQELSLAALVCTGTDTPAGPDKPPTPTDPDIPNKPTTPDALDPSIIDGGLGKKVTVSVESGHWLTIQTRRAGSVAIISVQAPATASGTASLSFSAATGSVLQIWETAEEMTFTNGVPNNCILKTAVRNL